MPLDQLFRQPDPLLDFIAENEGFRSTVYKDTKGLNTVGYGFNLTDPSVSALISSDVTEGRREMRRLEAEGVLQKRAAQATQDAKIFLGGDVAFNKLSENQKIGVVDMSFNMGLTRLRKFKKLRAALIKGDKVEAAKEVLDSKYARKDVPNRALKNATLILDEGGK